MRGFKFWIPRIGGINRPDEAAYQYTIFYGGYISARI